MDIVKLSERKQRILRALVENYIVCAEPVSSKEIRDKYLPEVSSATIRSEMMALEELGFLVQPHISAGRVPSAKAYRYYVGNIIDDNLREVSVFELKSHFDSKISEIEEVLKNTAKIISDVTNYTSVVVLGGVGDVLLKEIKLVDIGDNSALVILITDRGILKDKMIEIPSELQDNYFMAANGILNDIFAGRCVGDIVNSKDDIEQEVNEYRVLFDEVFFILNQYKDVSEGKIILEGADKIFGYKEYENIDNVRNFLSVINTKERLNELVGNNDLEFSIKIGVDDGGQDNMAIISARCMINGKEVARAGVIGPERMDYKKVIGVLHNIVNIIEGKE